MQEFNSFLDKLRECYTDLQKNDKNLQAPKWFSDYKILDNVSDLKSKILDLYSSAPDCRIRSLTKEMLDFIAMFQKCWYIRDKKYIDFKVDNAVRCEGVLKRLDDKQRVLSDNIKG